MLDVTDPTLVQDRDIANSAGANARRLAVSSSFNSIVSMMAGDVALITDERMVDARPINASTNQVFLDRRDGAAYEARNVPNDPHLGQWDGVFTQAALAIAAVHAYATDSLRGDYLAQLFAIRGYTALQVAEDICPGFPLNDLTPDGQPKLGGPLTTDSAITYAMSQLDSAEHYAVDSIRFLNLARVAKGRALLDLGHYAEAAAAVAGVPTDFVYLPDWVNFVYVQPYQWSGVRLAVGNLDGGTGLPFASAADPRTPVIYKTVRYGNAADSLYDQRKYTNNSVPMVVASGVEARLIEAEAALQANDPQWLAILNQLRATAITPAMSSISNPPATHDAQVDLLYRERAFWLYLTGRRLGDLRRLIRNYGRMPESVFPTGAYPLGGSYGPATAIPFVYDVQRRFNPHITSGCTTR